MTVVSVLDPAGRRRSPATMPGYHAGRPPRNKGIRYPAPPPRSHSSRCGRRESALDARADVTVAGLLDSRHRRDRPLGQTGEHRHKAASELAQLVLDAHR